jgi:DNA-binding NtrC family response regulator
LRKDRPDLVLLDIQMPGINGLDLLRAMRTTDEHLTVIMMTGYGSIEMAVEAMKAGAYDFITKPFDKPALFRAIGKGLEHNRLLRENIALRERIDQQSTSNPAGFVGSSSPMQRLYHAIRTTARTDYTVLIRGESGTGKELAARAIHQLSDRKNKPLFMVNCPAIPEHLLESELFGHRKGAFTGAHQNQAGLFLEANGGTLCLDEIGDIPVSVQTKLLRVLQEQEIKPLGSSKTLSVDVRIIASTNRNLEKQIQDHSFREDLFYRLNVVTLQTPSLSEIRDDIPLLIDHFARQVCNELDLPGKHFSIEAVEELVRRPWPGNVRELQNVVRGAILFCPEEIISPKYLRGHASPSQDDTVPLTGDRITPYKKAKETAINTFSRQYVTALLKHTGGNVSRAARKAGLTRAALQKIMRRQNIVSRDFRESSPAP